MQSEESTDSQQSDASPAPMTSPKMLSSLINDNNIPDGSTLETTTTTTSTTTETTSSLGVTINNTTITTTEKMLIVNTGENGSDTNDIANTAPIPTIIENDNTNNNNY
jgi:hypothetical protein